MKKHQPRPRKPKPKKRPAPPRESWWHGGLVPIGDYVLPRDRTGVQITDWGLGAVSPSLPDKVYITRKLHVAQEYAVLRGPAGCVYEVEPHGSLQMDPDLKPLIETGKVNFENCPHWVCESARIVRRLPMRWPQRVKIQARMRVKQVQFWKTVKEITAAAKENETSQ